MKKNKLVMSIVIVCLAVLIAQGIASELKTRNYDTVVIVGQGRLPEVDFGIYTPEGVEMNQFTYSGLMPNSRTEFTYYLKQKSNYNITVFVRWSFSCLPVQWLTMNMRWKNEDWSYTDSRAWNTTEAIPLTFIINIGNVDNTEWDYFETFSISTTP